MVLASSAAQVELCADATPSNTTQHLALYGLGPEPGTGTPAQQTATRRPTSTSHVTPASGWSRHPPQNNLLPIAPTVVDRRSSRGRDASRASRRDPRRRSTWTGIRRGRPVDRSARRFTLKVAHREIAAATVMSRPAVQVGSGSGCDIPVPLRRSATPAPPSWSTRSPLRASRASSTRSRTTSASRSARKRARPGVHRVPRRHRARRGLHAAGPRGPEAAACPRRLPDARRGGTAPVRAVGHRLRAARLGLARLRRRHPFEFRRGVVARAVVHERYPPGRLVTAASASGTALRASGRPGCSRLTATVDGAVQLLALVQVFDSPDVGRALRVLSWNLMRS